MYRIKDFMDDFFIGVERTWVKWWMLVTVIIVFIGMIGYLVLG